MRKYIIVILSLILIVATGVYQVQQVQPQTETQNKNIIQNTTKENIAMCAVIPELINPNVQNVQKIQAITGWPEELVIYFINEANSRQVKIYEEVLPLIHIESGGTYKFDLIHKNTNGTCDYGVFQINENTYIHIIKQLKAEGREFESWDKLNPRLNIACGVYWISYLKNNHKLDNHALYSSYNRGVYGAKQYASRNGTYETRYSREVVRVKNELLNY